MVLTILKVGGSGGLGDVVGSLPLVAQNGRSPTGQRTVSADGLFNPSFTRCHTRHQTMVRLLAESEITQ